MNTDKFTTADESAVVTVADAWSRAGSAAIAAETAAGEAAVGEAAAHGTALGGAALGGTAVRGPDQVAGDGPAAPRAAANAPAGPDAWSPIRSGPALAIAALAFACAQAFGGLIAGPLASLIPAAADSPGNHVRIIAVIYMGMSGVGEVLACVALRRLHDDLQSPRWAAYLAGAAVTIGTLVALQALMLLLLSVLVPGGH